jgi:glc operon protein GlcG
MKIRITTLAVLTSGLLLCGASGQAIDIGVLVSVEVAQMAGGAGGGVAVK